MNQITICGRVGKDGNLRDAGSTKVLGFPVACDAGWGDKKQTLWFNCSLFGNRANALAEYITKGSQVTVIGELTEREYEGKQYKEVNVTEIALQGGGKSDNQGGGQQQAPVSEEQVPF